MGCGDGLVDSIFKSDDPISNPADVCNFYSENCSNGTKKMPKFFKMFINYKFVMHLLVVRLFP